MSILIKLLCLIIVKIGHFIIQFYKYAQEIILLDRLGIKFRKCGTRVRYPFRISKKDCIEIGEGTEILEESRLNTYPNTKYQNPTIKIGGGCFFCYRLGIYAGANINIGDNVLVASDVTIDSSNHGINPESKETYMWQPIEASEIVIGDNCWIGEKVIIVAGVHIGRGCVIGAGSVVTRDVPDYCIAAGVPAKIIKKYDFDQHRWKRI